ncbi:ferric iron uptake transcriptional regulator [Parapusillimonas granuli]|uniref:Ferric uptake regulation protein n=1 Tax=Parapusillimonas granuli TaxID=380911 RepID=A0A853G4M4_9BURK|nr:ferric iron uptake transcriptional regulator [Parapusillimonas granuli]MBB5217494.1 Fur family ferric uptake transcriptional regulator [Parapusillimonas granuli]NYT51259.1 ferric iron uptake transcriptional regulator [Parapusillimonas granuli]NYT80272.1 ferric iron uptake transcriptional regulator [Alcaligenaceae bacterium]
MIESEELKRAGLKTTLPRLRILEVLEEANGRHLSPEDIYRHLLNNDIGIGLATVYRVLTQLQEAGLLKLARFEAGKAHYELDDRLHHDHLVCIDCGWVQEFHDEVIEQLQHRVAQRLGFELSEHTLVLYGRCTRADCERRHHKAPEPGHYDDSFRQRPAPPHE